MSLEACRRTAAQEEEEVAGELKGDSKPLCSGHGVPHDACHQTKRGLEVKRKLGAAHTEPESRSTGCLKIMKRIQKPELSAAFAKERSSEPQQMWHHTMYHVLAVIHAVLAHTLNVF